MKMKTNREVARREPPAAGLAAYPHRSTDGICSSHKKEKSAQLRTTYPPFTGSTSAPRGIAPQGLCAQFSNVWLTC